jgi:hypothetical protein
MASMADFFANRGGKGFENGIDADANGCVAIVDGVEESIGEIVGHLRHRRFA